MRRLHRGIRKNGGRCISIAAAVLLPLVLLLAASIRIQPVMQQMAIYTVADTVTKIVNDAVAERIKDGSLDYGELVTLEKDGDGNITALVTNMAKINALQTTLTNDSIGRVNDVLTTDIYIPIGNIIGGSLLSGRGPSIPVKVLSVTNSEAKFENQFSSAGINQTRHQIILNMSVDIEVLLPGDRISTSVGTEIIIAETIIVGQVPDTYAQLG